MPQIAGKKVEANTGLETHNVSENLKSPGQKTRQM